MGERFVDTLDEIEHIFQFTSRMDMETIMRYRKNNPRPNSPVLAVAQKTKEGLPPEVLHTEGAEILGLNKNPTYQQYKDLKFNDLMKLTGITCCKVYAELQKAKKIPFDAICYSTQYIRKKITEHQYETYWAVRRSCLAEILANRRRVLFHTFSLTEKIENDWLRVPMYEIRSSDECIIHGITIDFQEEVRRKLKATLFKGRWMQKILEAWEFHLKGYSKEEVGNMCGVSERTMDRYLCDEVYAHSQHYVGFKLKKEMYFPYLIHSGVFEPSKRYKIEIDL